MQEAIREADLIEAGLGVRYIRLPAADSREAYRDMEIFVQTIEEERLRDDLWEAIGGREAFRRFKAVLNGHYRERERWFRFKDARVRERVLAWLASEGIEPSVEQA